VRVLQAARGASLTRAVAADQQPQGKSDVPAGLEVGVPHRRIGALLAVAVAIIGLDIASKVTVVATLTNRAPIRLLGGFLKLRVDRNPGAAFSFAPGLTILFSLIAIAVIVVILRSSRRIRSLAWAITLGLLLGGATGNLIDRIFRSPGLFRGSVVDWIQVPHWPVFNLADSAIVCGGILAVLLSARGIRLDGQRETR
jgi:signal peptidase II